MIEQTDVAVSIWAYASYFAAPLVAVRLNYKSVTKSCVFTDHFNQGNFYFCNNTNVFTYFRLIIPTIS